MTLMDLILSIENNSEFFVDLNAFKIHEYIKEKYRYLSKINKNFEFDKRRCLFNVDYEQLSKRIKRSSFVNGKGAFFQDSILKQSNFKQNTQNNTDEIRLNLYDEESNPLDFLNVKDNDMELVLEEVATVNDLIENQDDETNRDYLIELTMKEIQLRLKRSEANTENQQSNQGHSSHSHSSHSQYMKVFYENQLMKIKEDNDLYTSRKLINYIKSLPEHAEEVLRKYKENFERIREYIDKILFNLKENIYVIPYNIRCICRIIHDLLQEKYPTQSIFERNNFISEFIFGKCIIPILANPDQYAVITSTFLSERTKITLISLNKIIKKINSGMLFESVNDMNLTMFNHYIIEIMPEMIEFYKNLIDVKLPDSISEVFKKMRLEKKENHKSNPLNLINKTSQSNEYSQLKEVNSNESYSYDYFKSFPDELINISCICYSVKDINLIISIIKKNFSLFKDDEVIVKAYNKAKYQESFLEKLEKDQSERKFMLAYKINYNPNLERYLEQKQLKQSFSANTSENLMERLKYCIKLILKNLNMLNLKIYTHLSSAGTTEEFLEILYQVVQFEEFTESENFNKIPLNWYALYLSSNISSVTDEYQENNYYKLYNEIIKEEEKEIEFLKVKSNLMITSFGLASNSAEKMNEQVNRDLVKLSKIHIYAKLERFIKRAKIKVCIRLNKQKEEKKKKGFFQSFFSDDKEKEKEKEKKPKQNMVILVKRVEECIHRQLQYLDELKEGKISSNIEECHAETILDFIKIFIKFNEIREDISTGEQKNSINETLTTYISLVKDVLMKSRLFNSEELTREEDVEYLLDEIENFIIKKLYKRVYPEKDLPLDKKFFDITSQLSFVTPQNLDIKKSYINEKIWFNAVTELQKIDTEKCPLGKLNCVINAVNIIINCIRFCTGKVDGGFSLDDFIAILHYIIIKSKPKRMASNLNFINTFLSDSKQKGVYGNVRTNLHYSFQFILEINHEVLSISKEEYDEKIRRYKLSKIG